MVPLMSKTDEPGVTNTEPPNPPVAKVIAPFQIAPVGAGGQVYEGSPPRLATCTVQLMRLATGAVTEYPVFALHAEPDRSTWM